MRCSCTYTNNNTEEGALMYGGNVTTELSNAEQGRDAGAQAQCCSQAFGQAIFENVARISAHLLHPMLPCSSLASHLLLYAQYQLPDCSQDGRLGHLLQRCGRACARGPCQARLQ